ncbi:MAG: DUF58 domain-containing protein [Zavarzinella sp.]
MRAFSFQAFRPPGNLHLIVRQIVEGYLTGLHRSPFKGYSIEFAEHRPYTPGDEIRHIDWRAFGKTDKYYIKEFEEETNLNCHLIIDISKSMAYRGKGQSLAKIDFARRLVAILAYMFLKQTDAVGLLAVSSEVKENLPPATTVKHLLRMFQLLENVAPAGTTELSQCIQTVACQYLKRRSLVVICSDFFGDLDLLTQSLKYLRHRNHEVILCQILDPDEIHFPFTRVAQFRNMETPDQMVKVSPKQFRDEYLKNFATFCNRLQKEANQLRMDCWQFSTDIDMGTALGNVINMRLRMLKGAKN